MALFLAALASCLVYAGIQFLRITLLPRVLTGDLHAQVAWRAATSLLLDWALFGAIVGILHLRGQGLADIGWRLGARFWGWLLAIAVTVLYCAFTLAGPLRHAPILSDWSLFRIGMAFSIGITAGICEETVFRGFAMGMAREGGAGPVVQIILSAVLFGLAHIGWGGLTGHFNVWAMVSSMIATLVLGFMLALVYLASKRSLAPPIAAHAAIDMFIEPWLLIFMVSGARFG